MNDNIKVNYREVKKEEEKAVQDNYIDFIIHLRLTCNLLRAFKLSEPRI